MVHVSAMDTADSCHNYLAQTETSLDAAYDAALWRVQQAVQDADIFLTEFLLKEDFSYSGKHHLWRMHSEIKALSAALAKIPFLKANYNPNQPRVPRGQTGGGQWTRVEGNSNPENSSKPETRPEPLVPPYDPPIERVYFIENLIRFLPLGRVYSAWVQLSELLIQNPAELEKISWDLGGHKTAHKWANRIYSRDWTPEEITETIAKGEKSVAPNRPNGPPHGTNTATRYTYRGRYLVRDDITKEILQLSDHKWPD